VLLSVFAVVRVTGCASAEQSSSSRRESSGDSDPQTLRVECVHARAVGWKRTSEGSGVYVSVRRLFFAVGCRIRLFPTDSPAPGLSCRKVSKRTGKLQRGEVFHWRHIASEDSTHTRGRLLGMVDVSIDVSRTRASISASISAPNYRRVPHNYRIGMCAGLYSHKSLSIVVRDYMSNDLRPATCSNSIAPE
jgi:hypothetical protein